jgi:DNA sulfur modification protein DndB
MKIPAIRATMGIWVYYSATMKFGDICEHVRRIDNELHKSSALNDLLQRSLTTNYKKIASYLKQQEERFFNALVLAVYGGDPQWREVRLDYGNDEEYYDIGILELTGTEKIFPIDGQHRVEGIKEALKTKPQLRDERVPVIFIGHRTDDAGMQRARRLFSTLNRYAKPVSLRDIIALDEDDAVAIATRDLIETHKLAEGDKIVDSKTKAISESNSTAFTTIITFYECNKELLRLFIRDKTVKDAENRMIRGNAKFEQYVRYRPEQSELDEYVKFCREFWDSVCLAIDKIKEFVSAKDGQANIRSKEGGCILFRPVALVPFVKAVTRIIASDAKRKLIDICRRMNLLPLLLTDSCWDGILWDSKNHNMIMNNNRVVELLFVRMFNPRVLTEKENKELVTKFAKAKKISEQDAVTQLDEFC